MIPDDLHTQLASCSQYLGETMTTIARRSLKLFVEETAEKRSRESAERQRRFVPTTGLTRPTTPLAPIPLAMSEPEPAPATAVDYDRLISFIAAAQTADEERHRQKMVEKIVADTSATKAEAKSLTRKIEDGVLAIRARKKEDKNFGELLPVWDAGSKDDE